jgi:hypothetical protein
VFVNSIGKPSRASADNTDAQMIQSALYLSGLATLRITGRQPKTGLKGSSPPYFFVWLHYVEAHASHDNDSYDEGNSRPIHLNSPWLDF